MIKYLIYNIYIYVLYQLQVYMEEGISSTRWLATGSSDLADGTWHDVQIRRRGENVTIEVDGSPMLERPAQLPLPLRTTSLLYIGGLPREC